MRRTACMPFIFVLLLASRLGAATEFDELDKPPEGAHRGQMLLGAFVSIGVPFGDVIDAESEFLKDSYYIFPNGTAKLIEVSHLSFGFGVSFEYMPMDYVGVKARLRRSSITQRSNFGTDYESFSGALYKDVSFYVGPSFHTTMRKRWDFTLTPLVGYAVGVFHAAPVGSEILENYISGAKLTGETERKTNGLTYGAELNCTIYFSGGLFISLGGEWLRNTLSFDPAFSITNPQQPGKVYLDGKTSGTIDSASFILTAGYAFSN